MATYTKYNSFVENLCNKLIDAYGATDVWKAVIHTDAPDNTGTGDSTIGNLTQIPGTNGYTTNGTDIGFTSARASGTGIVEADATDVTWTASGGALGGVSTGRYFSIYDDTSASDNLLCSFDYGATFNVAAGETMTLDFGTTFWTLQ